MRPLRRENHDGIKRRLFLLTKDLLTRIVRTKSCLQRHRPWPPRQAQGEAGITGAKQALTEMFHRPRPNRHPANLNP